MRSATHVPRSEARHVLEHVGLVRIGERGEITERVGRQPRGFGRSGLVLRVIRARVMMDPKSVWASRAYQRDALPPQYRWSASSPLGTGGLVLGGARFPRTPGRQMVEAPPQPFQVVLAPAADAEGIADVDRAVAPQQVELMERLLMQSGREPFPFGLLPAQREHVRREVAAIHVQSRLQQGQEEATGAAG